MKFVFETLYDAKGVAVMAEALRKTIRKKKSRRSHILAVLIILCAILLSLPGKDETFELTFRFVITWLVVPVMIVTLLFEDRLNGYFARKRMLTGMEKATATFGEESYISETAVGKTEFYYDNINVIAETDEYFVFIFTPNYAQIYDKNGMLEGTPEEFRRFIVEKTEKEIQRI